MRIAPLEDLLEVVEDDLGWLIFTRRTDAPREIGGRDVCIQPKASAIAGATRSGSRTAAGVVRGTNTTRAPPSSARRRASSSAPAAKLLPVPPAPVRPISRTAESSSHSCNVPRLFSRPTSVVGGMATAHRQVPVGDMRDPGARAFHERVACSAIQVQSGRNGTDGLHAAPAPLAAFERADGVDRKARDGREFLLRSPLPPERPSDARQNVPGEPDIDEVTGEILSAEPHGATGRSPAVG